jgi:programmed cell death protein 5
LSEDEELERIRQERMAEYQKQMEEAAKQEEAKQRLEMQKQSILRQILTPEARSRLNNLKMTPERTQIAEQLELYLINAYQAGRITNRITDEQLKDILRQLAKREKETKIVFKRK